MFVATRRVGDRISVGKCWFNVPHVPFGKTVEMTAGCDDQQYRARFERHHSTRVTVAIDTNLPIHITPATQTPKVAVSGQQSAVSD